MADDGVVMRQVVAQVDHRTTIVCLEADGQVRGIDEPFETANGAYMEPPFHVGCRSMVAAVLTRHAESKGLVPVSRSRRAAAREELGLRSKTEITRGRAGGIPDADGARRVATSKTVRSTSDIERTRSRATVIRQVEQVLQRRLSTARLEPVSPALSRVRRASSTRQNWRALYAEAARQGTSVLAVARKFDAEIAAEMGAPNVRTFERRLLEWSAWPAGRRFIGSQLGLVPPAGAEYDLAWGVRALTRRV